MNKPPNPKSNLPAKRRFDQLVNDISQMFIGIRRMHVQVAWQTGKRIVEEEQNGEVRAMYGTALLKELSNALTDQLGKGFSDTNLRKMRNFYLRNQKQAVTPKLSWTVYVELLPIKDEKVRKRLEAKAVKEGLNSLEIRQLVREKRNLDRAQKTTILEAKTLPPLKPPTDLALNTFSLSDLQVKLNDGDVLVDCGFYVSWPVQKQAIKSLDIRPDMAYTYAATIDRVVDGDTLLVLIEVGFGIIVRDRLRLRGINAPESNTPDGKRASQFVKKLLPVGATVIIKTHKSKQDMYGRFIVDVFFKSGAIDKDDILINAVYLNQYLVDKGHAQIINY